MLDCFFSTLVMWFSNGSLSVSFFLQQSSARAAFWLGSCVCQGTSPPVLSVLLLPMWLSMPSPGGRLHLRCRLRSVGRDLLKFTEIYWDILRFTEKYTEILRCTEIYWDILRYTEMYWDVLTYTEILRYTEKYTEMYWHILRYWDVLTYTEILRYWDILLRYTEMYWHILRYWDILTYTDIYWDTEIYWDILRFTEILRYTEIYWDLLRFTEIYWDLLWYTEIRLTENYSLPVVLHQWVWPDQQKHGASNHPIWVHLWMPCSTCLFWWESDVGKEI